MEYIEYLAQLLMTNSANLQIPGKPGDTNRKVEVAGDHGHRWNSANNCMSFSVKAISARKRI